MIRPKPPLRLLAVLALAVAALACARTARAACSFSAVRIVPEGLAPDDPVVLRVREAFRDRRLSTGATTVEIGAAERADLFVHVSKRRAWGEEFLVLERREGTLVVASQTLPMFGGGDSTGDVLLALRALVPCANAAPEPRVAQEPPGPLPRGQELTLDACATTDPDGDPLSYTWEQVADADAAPVALPDPRRCRLEGVRLPREGRYRFRVAVRDGVVTATRVVEVVVGEQAELRWRQAEGGAVGQPARIEVRIFDGRALAPPEELRCEILVAPTRRPPEARTLRDSCVFETPLPGWYRVRIAARARSGAELSALAELWVAPRTAVPIRGDASLGALLTAVGNVDLDFSLLVRSSGEGQPEARPGLRLGGRFLLLGRAGLSWFPAESGLAAASLHLGADLLGFTRLFDLYRGFGPAPRQFGLTIGVEHWEVRDPDGVRRGFDAFFAEVRFEVLHGLHVAARATPFAAPDRVFTLDVGLSLDELVGGLHRARRR